MVSTTFTPNLNIQALRIRKLCRGNGFYYQLETLRDAFQKRGYEKYSVESQIEEAESISRKELLAMKTKKLSKCILRFQKLKSS